MSIFQFEFMQYAFLGAMLASVACGVIGTYVVVKRIVFISGGIAHTAFGGIGLGYLLDINPVYTIAPFSVVGAMIIGILSRKTKISEDTAIGMLWAGGMALGILFIGLSPGYAPDLFSYLFGNILTIAKSDLMIMLALDIIILMSVACFYKLFLMICFDEEYAKSRGIFTLGYYLYLLALIALTIVILVRVVGIILVISMLTIPSAIARLFTNDLKIMMLISTAIAACLMCSGLMLSYFFDLPSGASIILLSILAYLAVYVLKKR